MNHLKPLYLHLPILSGAYVQTWRSAHFRCVHWIVYNHHSCVSSFQHNIFPRAFWEYGKEIRGCKKKKKEIRGFKQCGGGKRVSASSSRVRKFPWEHTLTHHHVTLLRAPLSEAHQQCLRQGVLSLTLRSCPLFMWGNLLLPCCTAMLLQKKSAFIKVEGIFRLLNNLL